MKESNLQEWTGKVREALEGLEAEGFALIREPSDSDLPTELRGLRPDFIGHRGPDLVVVEVSTRGEARRAQLRRLAEVVGQHDTWRLELLWVGEDIPAPPRDDVVARWLHITNEIAEISNDAALLTVWVALEAALERLVARQGIEDTRGPASRLITELYSLGVLSERQYNDLTEGHKTRGVLAHGRTAEVRPDLVERLASLAEWLASNSFVSVDRMVEAFQDEYEDPAEHVPYDSAEGGYQYIAGGPFDAREVLSELYVDAPEPDLSDAVDRLEDESFEWVRRIDY
ncbi:MAG TPA: HEPN-associated N-terminal domain-containing protein [Propionicimonas sp.]